MCDKCTELAEKIARLRRIAGRFADEQTRTGLAAAVADLEAEMAAMHAQ